MSKPRKPDHLKLIAGTSRPDRAGSGGVELPLIDEVPPPPDWLPNAHAVKEWDRLAPILIANRLLPEAGLSALATLCALHGKIVQTYAAGETPKASLIGQYRALVGDFGLTPIAQGKLRPSRVTRDDNPFARHRKP